MAQERYYASTAKQASLSSSIDSIATSMTLDLVTGFPTYYPYTLAIDPDTNKEELVLVTAGSGTILTITRAQDGTIGSAHSTGAIVRHVASGQDFNQFSAHAGSAASPTTTGVHGVTGSVVGTGGAQTLTGKTFSGTKRAGFDTASPTAVSSAGDIAWNTQRGTFDMQLNSNVTLQVGQEEHVYVRNTTGSTIPDMTLVMVTGVHPSSGLPTVAPAVTTGATDAKYMLGITTEDIANNSNGYVTVRGEITTNTTAWNEGDVLYNNPSVAGGFTTTAPAAPNLKLPVAFVTYKHGTQGKVMVRMTNGSALGGTDSNVEITTPLDKQLLRYKSSASRWENATLSPVVTLGGDLSGSATLTDLGSATLTATIASGSVTSAKILDGTIVNGDINAAAAIDKTKISGTAITAADTGTITSTMIADGTIVNADVNTSAQIAYSKLNLTNTIVNADVNASAAIDPAKISGTAVVQARTISTTAPLSGGGDLSANRTLSIADATTSVKGAVQLTDSTSSTSTTTAATPNSVKSAYDLASTANTTANAAIPATQKGAANGVATLDADSKIPAAQLPAIAISDTFVVASQVAMLALTAEVGDIAVRTDLNKSFILKTAGASTLANWQELLTPTDSVLSVDGRTGAVSLTDLYDAAGAAAARVAKAGDTMSGNLAMGGNKVTGVADPSADGDVVTKHYLDNVVLAPSNLTGVITSVGSVTSIASQTGTGSKFVVDTSPTLVTPNIGVATATSINGTAIPSSKTLVATDSTTYVVPSQSGNSGKYLTTDGSVSSWASVDALPAQSGHSGQYLTTNGSTASWASVTTDPNPNIFMMMGA